MSNQWLEHLDSKISIFLNHMYLQEGIYKYAHQGNVNQTSNTLAPSVFALKLLYSINSNDEQLIKATAENISRYVSENKVYDKGIYKSSFLRNLLVSFKGRNFHNLDNHLYIDADTRQSLSSLRLYNLVPKDFQVSTFFDNDSLLKFLNKFDWSRPWASGSHFSHYMFFLSLAFSQGQIDESLFEELQSTAQNFIYSLESQTDGTWNFNSKNLQENVNGAMKILTGSEYSNNFTIKYPEKLIDSCLKLTEGNHACDNFNIVYVLTYVDKYLNGSYRRNDIKIYLEKMLEKYKKHFKEDLNGFSFYPNKSNHMYYNTKVSKGLNTPDIHGTVLFCWGISLIDEFFQGELNSNLRPFKT